MNEVDNYKTLLYKYLQNDCNRKELKKILPWMNDPSNADTIEEMIREDWDLFNFSEKADVSSSFETILLKIKKENSPQLPVENEHRIRKLLLRIAAMFILPVAIGYSTYLISSGHKTEEVVLFNEITAPLGSKTIIKLGDSTKVWLNSGSTLRYPQKFSGKYREVALTGEAYFDVKRKPDQPFIVKTPEINIKVLGTSFNVKAYPEEGTVETTLVKGLISITRSNEELNSKNALYLNPHQRATYVKEQGKIFLAETEKAIVKKEPIVEENLKRKEKIILSSYSDPEPFTAWKDEKLVFKNEEFESLCIKLQRWYGVEINLKNEALRKYHYTGILQKETINDVMKILGYTMPIKYCIDHNVINIWLGKGEYCKN